MIARLTGPEGQIGLASGGDASRRRVRGLRYHALDRPAMRAAHGPPPGRRFMPRVLRATLRPRADSGRRAPAADGRHASLRDGSARAIVVAR
jgi:hypothetical protein